MNSTVENNIDETKESVFKETNDSFFTKILNNVLIKNSAISALNQAIISGANFIVALILVRGASKADYGYYSFAFAVLLLIVSIQNSVVTTPMSILLIEKKGEAKHAYVSSLLIGQIFFIGIICAISFLFIWLFFGELIITNKKIATAVALIISIAGVLLREFFRAYAFADEKPKKALYIDTKYIGIYLGAVLTLFYFDVISTALVFILMGVAAFISPAISSLGLKLKSDFESVKKYYMENWVYGRWSLMGVIVTHIQTYSYIYLLSWLLGSTAVADASASKLLLMPMVLFQAGWGNVVRPYGSRLREEHKMLKFFRQQLKLSALIFLAIIIYSLILYSLSDFLSNTIFTEKYRDALNYVIYWGVIFGISFLRVNASYGLQVLKDFKHITIFNFFSMIITIILSFILIQILGVIGSLIAFATGELSLALFLWYRFKNNIEKLSLK